MFGNLSYASAVTLLLIALSSCGKADGNKAPGQVAAKVNGGEISVHQIHNAMPRVGDVPPDQTKQAVARVLEQLIDQELLVQAALKARLDRDPQIMQTIEGARRQILARAYVDRAAAAVSPEGEQEVEKFYKGNPLLFEQRRIYRARELTVVAPEEKVQALKTAIVKAKSLDEITAWLRSENLQFQAATSSKLAEQVPMKILPRVFEMRGGQIAVFPTPGGASVVQLIQSEEAPLTEQQAAPVIKRFLLNRKRLEVTRAELKKLREQAKIEYVGEFEDLPPATPVPTAFPTETPSGGVEDEESVNKGLAGLK